MCGICGVAGGEPAPGLDLVRRMCDAMVHRGPDDAGSEQLGGVTLGMRRLSDDVLAERAATTCPLDEES